MKRNAENSDKFREMQWNVGRCREMQTHVEEWREMQRNADIFMTFMTVTTFMTLMTHGNVIFDILEPQVCPKTVNFAITVMILILIWFRFWFWLCGPTLCFQFCNRSWHNILSQYDLYRRHPWLLYHCVVAATHILGIINITSSDPFQTWGWGLVVVGDWTLTSSCR